MKCRRTLLKLNFKGPYSSSEREIKFRRCLFTSSIKRQIRHFHVVVVQKQERNVEKSVMHVRSCCFAYNIKPIVFLTFSLPFASLDPVKSLLSVQWQPLILELGGNPYNKETYISAVVSKEKLNMHMSIMCQF